MQKLKGSSFLVQLIAIISLLVATPAYSEEVCNEVLHFQKAAALISHANHIWKENDLPQSVVLAKSLFAYSENFRKFYFEKTGLEKLDPAKATPDLIATYHEDFFREFHDPASLERLQSAALNQALITRGASIDLNLSGRQNLEAVSRKNMERILGPDFDEGKEFSDYPIIKIVIRSLKVNFTRNSHYSDVHGDFILSSHQLAKYSGKGGYNTTYPFNRDLLKSDDNIFFWTGWSNTPSKDMADKLIYGLHETQMNDNQYANQHGWISYFVMWPNDLRDFAVAHLNSPEVNLENREGIDPEKMDLTLQFISHLHELDFTVSDYESLVRILTGRSLIKLMNESSRHDFAKSVSVLLEDPKQFSNYLYEKVLNPYHLNRMEFKIPVAVPADKISEILKKK